MMLEVCCKLNGTILLARLKPIKEGLDGNEGLDHETQYGFRSWRGCIDAIFSAKMLTKKRREHGQEAWLLFIDLVKAFDRVPLKLLWLIMAHQGVPSKLISLLKGLHTTVFVKFEIDGVVKTMKQIIGVKQGDVLGPDLFIFLIAAIMETWRSQHIYDLCIFRTARDFQLEGRRSTARLAARLSASPMRSMLTTRPSPFVAAPMWRSRHLTCSRTSRSSAWRCTQVCTRNTTLTARRRCSTRTPSPRPFSARRLPAATQVLRRS